MRFLHPKTKPTKTTQFFYLHLFPPIDCKKSSSMLFARHVVIRNRTQRASKNAKNACVMAILKNI